MDENWKSDLERWLSHFLDAARAGDVGYDQLHHFIASALIGLLAARKDALSAGTDRTASCRISGLDPAFV